MRPCRLPPVSRKLPSRPSQVGQSSLLKPSFVAAAAAVAAAAVILVAVAAAAAAVVLIFMTEDMSCDLTDAQKTSGRGQLCKTCHLA